MKAAPAIYANPNRPWEANPGWNNGQIHSTAASSMRSLFFFTLLWNLISFPVSWFALNDIGFAWPDPAWLVLLFPTVGLILIASSLSRYLQWKKFGRLNLTLDPFPGSIGGDLGGYLDIPLPYRPDHAVSVTLNCVNVHYSRNSKGGKTRHETVKWRRHSDVRIEPAARGTRLRFRTEVDAGLPDSEPETENYHQWVIRVHVERTGIDLDRDFIVPVFDTGQAVQSRFRFPNTGRPQDIEFPKRIVRISQRGSELALFYPSGRGSGTGTALLLVGLIFAAAGGFLSYQLYEAVLALSHDGLLFQVGVLGLMAPVFSLIGLFLVLAGLYTMLNSLRVRISPAGIETERRILGIPLRRELKPSEVTSIAKRITAQSGQGSKGTVYYTINASNHAGKRLVLGDGIKGQPVADRIIELIRDAIPGNPGFIVEPGGGIRSIKDRASTLRSKGSQLRWAGHLIAFVIFAFFIYDFFRMFSG